VKDLLPPKPAEINVEPWWNVEVGCVIEEDIKVCIVYQLSLCQISINIFITVL
jgi:hypothetical protein